MGIGYELNGNSSFFGAFSVIFTIILVLLVCIFLFVIIRGLLQWNKNNNSPKLTVNAQVVGKRIEVSHHHHNHGAGNSMHFSSSTWYYVTFQVESGDRIELAVNGYQYGMIAEGDLGRLTFQGTRYIDFIRQ